MAKKFLIFTSICTVLFSILALVVTPFAVEDLSVTAKDYYEKSKGLYDEEFVNSSEGIKTLYLKNQYENLTVKKSDNSDIKIFYTNNTLNKLDIRASKIDDMLTIRTTYNHDGFNEFRRENILKGVMNMFYFNNGLMTEVHVPDGVEVLLEHEPWDMLYVDDDVKVAVKNDDRHNNNSNNNPSKTDDTASSSETPSISSSVPKAPIVIDAVYVQEVKNKLATIETAYTNTYNDYKAKVISAETTASSLENLMLSEAELLRSFSPNDDLANQYESEAARYANIIVRINMTKIDADNLLAEYTAGTIAKPEYYEKDLQLYNAKTELENAKKEFPDLEVHLIGIENIQGIKFPFTKILE